MTTIEWARLYLGFGWSVIPVNSSVKGGATLPWRPFQTRRPTAEELAAWFDGREDVGVAVVTGAISNIIVLDQDRHGDHDGVDVVKALYGWEPDGVVAKTGGGGLHTYLQHPGGIVQNRTNLLPGVDLRGDGGFVYAPPSPHPSGTRYEWMQPPGENEVMPAPGWLMDLLMAQGVAGTANGNTAPQNGGGTGVRDELDEALLTGVDEGRRNDVAARLAGRYLALGNSPTATLYVLRTWNQLNRPPMPDQELQIICQSITRKELMKRAGIAPGVDAAGVVTDRATVMQGLAERFGIPLDDIVRVGGSEPFYRFSCAGQEVDVRARDVGSQSEWRRSIIAVSKRVPTSIGRTAKPGWDYYLQLMLNVARDIDPGPEATNRGQLSGWLRAYLETAPPCAEGDPTVNPVDPRIVDGMPHVHASSLRKFINLEQGQKVTGPQLVQMLSSEGCERRTLHVKTAGGKRTSTRSFWRVAPGLVGEDEAK